MTQNSPQAHRPFFRGYLQQFNTFLDSPAFIFLAGLLVVVANLFHLELAVYTVFVLLGCYTVLFHRHFLPVCILFVLCYVTPSASNNPGIQAQSIFYPANGGIYLICLFALFLGCTLYRLFTDGELGKKNLLTKPRRLLSGMLILGGAYLLAGAFSGRYFERGAMNLVFALLQILSVAGLYWLFSATVRWDTVPRDYWAWAGMTIGLTVCTELIGIYFTNDVIVNGKIQAARIYSGWGNANNIGCMITMMIPFPVMLAKRSPKTWPFCLLTVLMVLCVCLTCSRTSILAAILLYIGGMVLAMTDTKKRKAFLIFNGILILVLGILTLIFRHYLGSIFQELIKRAVDPRNRDVIYPAGLEAFSRAPIFGESFYPSAKIDEWSKLAQMKAILPARWHNTIIQLLASCGITGLVCYGIHRVQTVRLFWQKRKTDAVFLGVSLLSLLMMSLLDCHFFNIGPTFFYSITLAFAECMPNDATGV